MRLSPSSVRRPASPQPQAEASLDARKRREKGCSMQSPGYRRTCGPRQTSVVRLLLAFATLAVPRSTLQPQRLEPFTAWTHPVFPVAEYVSRRTTALGLLRDNDLLLVPSAEGTSSGETFRQLDDFEYLVGLEVPRSVLALDGRTQRAILFVPHDDPRFENQGRPNDFPGRPLVSDPALRALSGVDAVLADSAVNAFLSAATTRGARVLINRGRAGEAWPSEMSAFASLSPGEMLALQLQRAHAELTLGNAYTLLATLRMIKSPREVATMREAARLTMVAIARGAARATPGVDERTLTGEFIADCMSLGAQRPGFTPIIKSGDNSLWPWRILGAHYDRRNRALHLGDLVIYDVGCEYNHYVSDVGRTFPVDGHFTPRQRELVEMVRKISDVVMAAARPGATLAELQRVAVAAIPQVARPFMQAPVYFGHHLGLDAGDPSLADTPLAAGMVFTIEPWYYNHDERVAVFLEDEILVTVDGSENLTVGLPRDADGLERLRAGRESAYVSGNAMRNVTRDGVLSFTLDRGAGQVHVYDLLNGTAAGITAVCPHPVSGELSPDDVTFLVRCAGGDAPSHVNTASYAVVPPPAATTLPTVKTPAVIHTRKNQVVVVGTIHGEHRTSTRYGTDVLRKLLIAMRPDYVLTEIAPNRMDAAAREFNLTGKITEPRVVRFPEYVDVLFPLTKSMRFTIVPTAGWTKPMDTYRTATLKRIETDTTRREEWLAYTRANQVRDSLVALHGADDPYFIHSTTYDSIEAAAHEPYNRLFNSELGPGGWDNINEAHFANIARALDEHRGEGRRFVITYGAGHKEWFMRALRRRDDIDIMDVAPFLEQIGAKR